MPFANPQVPPPPIADAFVEKSGALTADAINWFLINLLPAVAQSPSVFSVSGPVLEIEEDAAYPSTPLPLGSLSSGLYRVTVFLRVTSPDGVSSSVTPRVHFTRTGVACTMTGGALTSDTISTPQGYTFPLMVDAPGPISFETLYASNTPNLMEYEAVVTVERVQ